MISLLTTVFLTLLTLPLAALAEHGDGDEGTIMGPVAFLWPENRNWSSSADNTPPCGSSAGIKFRTNYPLDMHGNVALTIADESYDIDIKIAYGNNPTSNDEFSSLFANVSDVIPGHQCYSVPIISSPSEGSNATIQLEYWGNDSGFNQSFYACADITFVSATAFDTSVPCFNVTEANFGSSSSSIATSTATGSTTATSASTTTTSTAAPATTSSSSDSSSGGGLSAGAKAGIAIGSIVGAAVVFGVASHYILRYRRQQILRKRYSGRVEIPVKQTASQRSGSTN